MKLFTVTVMLAMTASIPVIDPVVFGTQEEIQRIYQEEVDRAFKLAPEDKSIFQLRGDANTRAEELFKKAAELYDIPEYDIGALLWDLRDDRAGAATACRDGPPYEITMNEILFLRNYDDMMHQTIAHEVAHVVTCLRYPELTASADFQAHGPSWQAIIHDLGGQVSQFHNLDITPINLYHLRVDVALLTFIVENQ